MACSRSTNGTKEHETGHRRAARAALVPILLSSCLVAAGQPGAANVDEAGALWLQRSDPRPEATPGTGLVGWSGSIIEFSSLEPIPGARVQVESTSRPAAVDDATNRPAAVGDATGRPAALGDVTGAGSPRGDVRLQDEETAAGSVQEIVVDSRGRFEIEAPSRGRLRLSADGYLDGFVELTPMRGRSLGPLVLRRAVSLQGRLLQDGAPVAGARLMAPDQRGRGRDAAPIEGAADDQGRFVLEGLRPERLGTLYIVTDGVAQRLDLGSAIRPVDPRSYSFGDLEIQAPRTVTGRAVDAREEPVAGATVWPTVLEGRMVGPDRAPRGGRNRIPYPTATTGPDGRFRLRLLPGVHRLWVMQPGRGMGSRRIVVRDAGDRDARTAADDLPMEIGEVEIGEVEIDDVDMGKGRMAGGRVVDGGGIPLEGVRISLEWVEGWPSLPRAPIEQPRAVTGPDGCFRFEGVPAGTTIRVVVKSSTHVDPSGFSRQRFRLSPVRPTAASAPCGSLPEIELVRSGRLVGTLVDDAGEPVVGAEVSWRRLQSARGGGAMPGPPRPVTGADGSFEIDGLVPGDYELRVFEYGYLNSTSEVLVVEPARTTEAFLRLAPVVDVLPFDVRVEDHRGIPVPDMEVHASIQANNRPSRMPSPESVWTGADGRVSFESAPVAVYSIMARADVSWMGTAWQGPFRPGSDIPPFVLRLRPPPGPLVPVSGRLVDADGRGVPAAVIDLERDGRGRDRFQTLTEAGGRFRFDGVPAGRYVLTAAGEGIPEVLRREVLEVRASAPLDLVVEVPEPGAVVGRVTGVPAEDLQDLRIAASSRYVVHETFGAGIRASTRVNAEGRFRLEGLVPGEWRLEATSPDQREAVSVVTIEQPGQEVTTTLDFPGGGFTVTGKITWRGAPVESGGISFYRQGARERRWGTVDSRGNYRVENLRPGLHEVRIAVPPLRSPFVDFRELEGEASVDFEVRGGAVRGRIVDAETGEPVVGAYLRTDPVRRGATVWSHSHDRSHRTDREGRFDVGPFAAGAWKFGVRASGYAHRTPVIEIGDEDIEGYRIALGRSPGLALRFQPPTPHIPDALGLVWQDGATGEIHSISAFPGTVGDLDFQWDGIPLGRGVLTVTDTSGLAHRSVVTNEGEPIHVPLEDAGRLVVRTPAFEESGSRATLSLIDSDGVPVPSRSGRVERTPGREGDFVVRALPPGTYRAEVVAPDGRTWSREVEIRPLEVTEVVMRREEGR